MRIVLYTGHLAENSSTMYNNSWEKNQPKQELKGDKRQRKGVREREIKGEKEGMR